MARVLYADGLVVRCTRWKNREMESRVSYVQYAPEKIASGGLDGSWTRVSKAELCKRRE